MMNTNDRIPLAIYPGRFQPPHPGHHAVYEYCVKLFGPDNVYLATSNKQGTKSPFDFQMKKFLWVSLFGIPLEKIVQCKNPAFEPKEIMAKFPNRPVVLIVSEKDIGRYERYIRKYPPDGEILSWEKELYYLPVPVFYDNLNATTIRNLLKENNETELKRIYGDRYVYLKFIWNRIPVRT